MTEGELLTSSTRSTSTSLRRLARTLRAVSSSARTTRVMRDTFAVSVAPTASDSMLYPRLRTSETTRLRTPGLSSTVARKVRAEGFLVGIGSSFSVFHELGCGPSDHVAQVGVRRDHRIDAVLGLDAEIDHHGAGQAARALHRLARLGPRRRPQSGEPVRLGELDEIGAADGRRDVAAGVEELLPLADHPQVAVVDDGDVELHALLRAGGELAGGHLEPAVAGDHPDVVVRAREAGAETRGKRETHGAEAT